MKILIGIDPGVNTGFAVSKNGVLIDVFSCKIHGALKLVDAYIMDNLDSTPIIYVEDARKRKYFGKNSNEKLQGAGSVKRDCKIWEDFLIGHGVKFFLVDPKDQKGATKKTADEFKVLTGWQGRTNEHARDAALLIFGR